MSFLHAIPSFTTLSLSTLTGTEGSNFTATVTGKLANTTLAIVDCPPNFSLSGLTITGINPAVGTYKFKLVEYLPESAFGYRKEISFTVTITAIAKKPVVTVLPVITGKTSVGNTLTVTTGTWNFIPTGYTYQWYRESTAIGSATAATYLLVAADRGKNISVRVTATNATGSNTVASLGTPHVG